MKTWARHALRGALGLLCLGALVAGRFAYRTWAPPNEPRELLPPLVSANSPEGKARLARTASVDMAPLTNAFVAQQHGSFCGIASSVIALGTLGVAHVDQSSFFDERSSQIQSYADALFGGITLDELGGLLEAHGAKVRVVHVTPGAEDAFRKTLRDNFSDVSNVLLVNYDREKVGEDGHGHISPLAAYDQQTDSVLLMDVAAYKYPPHWVPVGALYDAMATIDSASDVPRGYVEVSR